MGSLEIVTSHPRHRMPMLAVVDFTGGVLRLDAGGPVRGALAVIRSSDPISVRSAKNCDATLKIGWDGTLGYSLYALHLDMPSAGDAVVEFDIWPPPERAIGTTQEVTRRFVQRLHSRASRFADQPEFLAEWQARWRKKLAELLMPGAPPERVAADARQVSLQAFDRFELHSFEFHSRRDRMSTALLSIPTEELPSREGRLPLVVALHGHEATWGAADVGAFTPGHNDDFCAYFASRGWMVLQPATMDHTLQRPGWTLQGEWTWDVMRALDWALARPEVDSSRVAVVGLSTGAHLAMNMLAFDTRVRAGVVGCVLSTWHHVTTRLRIPPHCDCGISGQLSPHLEECDWAVLAAPKPVQFQHGRQDQTFCPGADEAGLDLKWNMGVLPRAEYDAMFEEVRRGWRLAGAADQVETRYHEGKHQINNADALAWLTRCLHD